jgi:hypothetical protein|eukprot:TRINITY_DN96291_c0_g1_i2.p1 TRINITY_DN96291_c0_g1~~TRINITY_DN96291_c0_g1_i2.p1  ORF type:complete len:154 (-),score=4.58 TRINITY_DN96291_c0_g1_i2:984-1445(-)
MSQTSTSSTASSHSSPHATLAALKARAAALDAATEQRRADHAHNVKAIEVSHGAVLPTFAEMETAVLKSGALWTTPKSMTSLLKLHNDCVAPPPDDQHALVDSQQYGCSATISPVPSSTLSLPSSTMSLPSDCEDHFDHDLVVSPNTRSISSH